jgi:hypothetical protein
MNADLIQLDTLMRQHDHPAMLIIDYKDVNRDDDNENVAHIEVRALDTIEAVRQKVWAELDLSPGMGYELVLDDLPADAWYVFNCKQPIMGSILLTPEGRDQRVRDIEDEEEEEELYHFAEAMYKARSKNQ